jgi:NADH:ubiquinone reductase (H+-translocating)
VVSRIFHLDRSAPAPGRPYGWVVEPRVQRVVVVGSGFAGLAAARELAAAPVRVTVVDRRNHHLFQPLLYQVATAALNPADISAPIRRVLRRQRNAEVVLGELAAVDTARRTLTLRDGGTLAYDYLVVATGASHSYLGHDAWQTFAPGLKTVEDALEIRRRILTAFERAEWERDPDALRSWTTFVLVGGGPTGVELAGAIAEIARNTLARDFRHVSSASARVILLEAMDRVLPTFPATLSASARRQLERIGVEVRTAARVTAIDPEGVTLGDERIGARTVLWCAGVAASGVGALLGGELDRAGKVRVEADLSLSGHPEVFVAGDLAAVQQADGASVPGLAPAAIQEGRHAAWNVIRAVKGLPGLPFRYEDRGLLATVGRAAAVARLGRLEFSGLVAWLLWLLVHILSLVGFRNRAAVMLQWAWSYVTFDRGARLITETAASRRLPPP